MARPSNASTHSFALRLGTWMISAFEFITGSLGIPEPSALVLIASGLGLLGLLGDVFRRRRMRAAA